MKRKAIVTLSAILLGAYVSGMPMAALAADSGPGVAAAGGRRSVTVFIGDLNLSSDAGVEVLYQRLRSAAERVCETGDMRVPGNAHAWRRCYSAALDRAVERVGNGSLDRLHAQHTGRQDTNLVASEP